MRLTVTFVTLLMIATTGMSYVWRGLGDRGDPGSLYQLSVLFGLMTAILSVFLLARIVVKASVARQRLKEQ